MNCAIQSLPSVRIRKPAIVMQWRDRSQNMQHWQKFMLRFAAELRQEANSLPRAGLRSSHGSFKFPASEHLPKQVCKHTLDVLPFSLNAFCFDCW